MARRKSAAARKVDNPERRPPKRYYGAKPGYGVDEVQGNPHFETDDKNVDLVDEARVTEELVEAGVAEPLESDKEKRITEEDREFAESKIATRPINRSSPEPGVEIEKGEGELEELPKIPPLKAERS
jgi:hypothetical protein